MITKLRFTIAVLVQLALILAGCSSDSKKETGDKASQIDDAAQIQEALTEVITRWHYGDKSALYDNEFEYLQLEYSFDDYLELKHIRPMEADTVRAVRVHDIQFFGRDSADADVEIVFVGPSGDTSCISDVYRLYHFRDRWIRPTLSTAELQQEFDDIRREADSAAEAESDNEEW